MGFVLSYVLSQAKLMTRSKSTLFWTIVFPLMMTLLFTSIWGNPERSAPKLNLAVVIEDNRTAVLDGILRGINSSPIVDKLVILGNRSALIEELRAPPPRGVDAGIVFPQGFTSNITRGLQAKVIVYYLDIPSAWTNTTLSMVKGLFDEISRHIRQRMVEAALQYVPAAYRGYILGLAEPVKLAIEPVEPKQRITGGQVKAWIALSMAVIEAIFIGLIVGATSFHEERRYGLLQSMLSSPIGSWSLLAARLLTALLYTAVASLVAVSAGWLAGAEYSASLPAVLVAAVMVALATIFSASIGLVVSMVVRREEAAVALANAIAFPLMFIGGLWIPKWLLPPLLQRLADLLPVSHMADAARAVIVYGVQPLRAIAEYTPPAVLAVTAATFVVALASYRYMLSKSLES